MHYIAWLMAGVLLVGGEAIGNPAIQQAASAGKITRQIQQELTSQNEAVGEAGLQRQELAPTVYDCFAQNDILEVECLALVALFNATGGSSWTNKNGWLVTDPPGWFGITLDVPHVKQIVLPNNGLIGPIPIELGDLPELEVLHLERNGLSGPIPVQLGNLAKVTSLYLQRNQLTGPIPSTVGGLTSLIDVHLHENLLTGPIPAGFADIPGLHHLLLQSNQLHGSIPAELGWLTELTYLQLADNLLSGPIPPSLGNLTTINNINLSGNQFSGAVPFKLAEIGASATTCNFSGNAALCMPNLLDYQALGNPLCGLPLDDTCILLPVELVSFDAVARQDDIAVFWETAAESQASGFELQYQIPEASGGNAVGDLIWESIAFIEATGSSTSGGRYSYHLPIPNALGTDSGTRRFRLRMVDLDGSFTYSPAIEVVTELTHSIFLGPAIPNPFTSQTRLHFSGHAVRPVKVSLFDVAGQLVEVLYEGIPAAGRMHELRIDGSGLSSGMYIVQLEGPGLVESQKIVFQK